MFWRTYKTQTGVTMKLFTENRQIRFFLMLLSLVLSIESCPQKNETKTKETTKKEDYLKKADYSIRTDIINPDTLKGDQKKIFYHPYFLKLTHEEAENLEPQKIKEELIKLGISGSENDRFVDAYIFYKTYYLGHKKDCEYFAYFEFLKPKSKN